MDGVISIMHGLRGAGMQLQGQRLMAGRVCRNHLQWRRLKCGILAHSPLALVLTLTIGAAEALHAHGSDALKDIYLEKLVSGEWMGTMNLTEPQAGSDLNALRAKAEPVGDGTYRIYGQKIYITYGEHDFTDNIVHLVLARLPDAPEGTRGISLFSCAKISRQSGWKPLAHAMMCFVMV